MQYIVEYEQAGVKKRSEPFKSFWMAVEYKIMISGLNEAKVIPVNDYDMDLLNAKKEIEE